MSNHHCFARERSRQFMLKPGAGDFVLLQGVSCGISNTIAGLNEAMVIQVTVGIFLSLPL
jgi:hypothetical protein